MAGAWARMALTAAGVTAVDQAAKAAVVASLDRGESVNVFLGLDLTNVRNSGVAFGLLSGASAPVGVLIAATLALLVGYFARHSTRRLLWLPVGLLAGGAVGNLVDRIREGTVVDFIDPIGWPAFNLADTAIVLGVLGLLYAVEGDRESRARQRAA